MTSRFLGNVTTETGNENAKPRNLHVELADPVEGNGGPVNLNAELGRVNSDFDDNETNKEATFLKPDTVHSENSKPQATDRRICGLRETTYRVVFGIVLVIIIAVSWTSSTQFAKSAYKTTFNAPYFIAWLGQMLYVLIFPLYMISVPFQRSLTFKQFIRKSLDIVNNETAVSCRSWWLFLAKAFIFTFLAVFTNFFYLKSLDSLSPATVSAIFSSQSAFVYVLSILFLGETFLFLRILTLSLSVGGMVLMSYSEGFNGSSSVSILFTCIASLGSATYQVAFKRVMKSANGSQVAFFFSVIGLLVLVFFWPIIFLLRHVNYEQFEWNDVPWFPVLGTAIVGLIFSYSVNFGVVFTYPLFISIGTLLGVPLNAIIDTIFRNENFDKFKIVATVMILTGFCMLLVPIERMKKIERQCCANRWGTDEENDTLVQQA